MATLSLILVLLLAGALAYGLVKKDWMPFNIVAFIALVLILLGTTGG